jgi:hypothetical protein
MSNHNSTRKGGEAATVRRCTYGECCPTRTRSGAWRGAVESGLRPPTILGPDSTPTGGTSMADTRQELEAAVFDLAARVATVRAANGRNNSGCEAQSQTSSTR